MNTWFPPLLLLLGIVWVAFLAGLAARLGWRLGGRALPRPAATASRPPRRHSAPSGEPPWTLCADSSPTSPPRPSAPPDWAEDTPVQPYRPQYTPYSPSYRQDKALQ